MIILNFFATNSTAKLNNKSQIQADFCRKIVYYDTYSKKIVKNQEILCRYLEK